MSTLTPAEISQVLDVAAKSPVTLHQGYILAPVLQKLIALANQPHPIGAVVPFTEREAPHCSTCECGVKSVPTGTAPELPDYSPQRGYHDTNAP